MEVKKAVKERYGEIARGGGSCCGAGKKKASCCGPSSADATSQSREAALLRSTSLRSAAVGYGEEELRAAPEGANLGLGCGNPLGLAEIRPGDTVLDLGSGGGFDCFLAAGRVGPEGRVVGVDMTEEMIARARENAKKGGFANVEFRLGEIEKLPVGDGEVDLVISNCVLNLVPDKAKAFREIARVLKEGGRVMISDIVRRGELPATLQGNLEAYAACVAGALEVEEYLGLMKAAGLAEVQIVSETDAADLLAGIPDCTLDSLQEQFAAEIAAVRQLRGKIFSVTVKARKL